MVLALAAAFALTVSASAAEATSYNCSGANFTFSSVETGGIVADPTPQAVIDYLVTKGAQINSIQVAGAYNIDTSANLARSAVITVNTSSTGTVAVKGGGNNLTVNGGTVTVSGTVGDVDVTGGSVELEAGATAGKVTVSGGTVFAYGNNLAAISVDDGSLYLNCDHAGNVKNAVSFTALSISGGNVYAVGNLGSGNITVNGSGALSLGYLYDGEDPVAAADAVTSAEPIKLVGNVSLTVNANTTSTQGKIIVIGQNAGGSPVLTVESGDVYATGDFGTVTVSKEGTSGANLHLGSNGTNISTTKVYGGMSVLKGGTVVAEGASGLPVTITNTASPIIDIQNAGSTVTLNDYVTVGGEYDGSMTGVTLNGGTFVMEAGSKIDMVNTGGAGVTAVGINNSGDGVVTVKEGASVAMTNNADTSGATLIGVRSADGMTTVYGGVTLTNSEGKKVGSMFGVEKTADSTESPVDSLNVIGTITLTNSGTVSGEGMSGVYATGTMSGTVNVTGNVTLNNSAGGTVSVNMFGVYSSGSGKVYVTGSSAAVTLTNNGTVSGNMTGVYGTVGEVNVTNATIQVTGRTAVGNTMRGVENSGSSVYVTDATVTLTNAKTDSCGVYSGNGKLIIRASAGLTENLANTANAASADAAAPSVKVTTDNGTALHLGANSKAAIRGGYGAAKFETTGSGCNSLTVGGDVTTADTYAPVIACGTFVDGTGAAGSSGDVLADNNPNLLNDGVNYYVSNAESSSTYTVTDAVWAIQYYMGEAEDVTLAENSAYSEDTDTFTLPCNVNFTDSKYKFGMYGALQNEDANRQVTVAGDRTLDLNGHSITGASGTNAFTSVTEGCTLTVVNGSDDGGSIAVPTTTDAINLSKGDVVVRADNGNITISRKSTARYSIRTGGGSVGVYARNNAVVTIDGRTTAVNNGVTVGTYTTGSAAVVANVSVTSANGNVTLMNHGAGGSDNYTGMITINGYVSAGGDVNILNGDNDDDSFGSAIHVLGEGTGEHANVSVDGANSVTVSNVSTYSADDAVKIAYAVRSTDGFVRITDARYNNAYNPADPGNTPPFVGSVGNVSVGNVTASSDDVWVGVYSVDDAATVTLGAIKSGDNSEVGVYNSGNAAIVVDGNIVGGDGSSITLANIGLRDGCTYGSTITVNGFVNGGTTGNVSILNGDNNTDVFRGAIHVLGDNAGNSVVGKVVAASNASAYSADDAVKIAGAIKGQTAAAVVNGYSITPIVPVANVSSVQVVGNVVGGAVYVNSYTTNDSVTVDLGAIKSGEGKDVNIYSTGKSMLTVNGDVNDGVTATGDVGVYATDTAAVAILGTVYSGTSGDVLIENASAYSAGDAAIKIAPAIVGNDAVSFKSSGTLTIANNNEDASNSTNGKILIAGSGDGNDGVYISDENAKLKVSNKAGAVITVKSTGTDNSYGLNIGNANVQQRNIYITDSTATYSSVNTLQSVGVYKGLLGDAYDWKVDDTDLPRTAANYFANEGVAARTVRTTLGDNNSATYSVGAAVSYTLKVEPSSENVSTTDPVTPTVSLMSGTTNLGNAAITAVAFDPAASAAEDGNGQNPVIHKTVADSSKVTVTYTDAYGKTANYVMNPSTPYVPPVGGGGAAAPATTVPVSGASNSVAVNATVSGNTATMRAPTEQQLQSVIGASVRTGEVAIDMSGLGSSITTAAIPTETFKAISQAVSATNNDANALTIKVANGSVTFDATALSAIANEATASTVSLNVSKTTVSGLNAAQRAAVQAISSQAVYSITVTSGSKTIATFANGSATISVPYTLTSGQFAAGLVVWYVADDGTMTEIPCTFAGGRVVFTVTHFSNYAIAYDASRVQAQTGCPKDSSCPISAFSDASANAWYHDGVHWALENVIMSGRTTADGAKVFDPNGTTSRAMVAQILWNLEGRPAATGTAKFNDVADSAWYASAINWAASANIVNGYDDPSGSGRIFKPDDAVTREQLAAMLYRYAQSKGQGFQGAWAFPLNYPDAASVADWAYEAMCWMTMHGIINGVDGQLAPSANASRAVVATMLQRYTDVAK